MFKPTRYGMRKRVKRAKRKLYLCSIGVLLAFSAFFISLLIEPSPYIDPFPIWKIFYICSDFFFAWYFSIQLAETYVIHKHAVEDLWYDYKE